ncbi:FadR/GntR family transcriptional regulator [Streptomyces albidus (ex Kaewkla and Franco 2022)]|uniref:FadR/GntR family transcriptional regulator n=1 Tax=Streptomyces albidus (ex Kaewkla and Franco 2022) TaxID=722709 RepID=UPI0015EEF19F|nr:FadR/GntR family transcriptional regulator [Streptomyces albidus (ex Kaewkla and Franco 2022)]
MGAGRADTVADALLRTVVDGEFTPGDTLPSEADLANRFGVSRLTVREAIRSLASTRVIHVRQGRSSVINPVERWSPLDPRLLKARGEASGDPLQLPRRLLEARRAVEVSIAELAAGRRDDQHVERLALWIDRMREADRDADVPRFVEADLAFHRTLFEAVDNVFLDALFQPLSSVVRDVRAQTSSVPEIREHAIEWHARILAGVEAGDADEAREAMRGHLMQTENDMDFFLARQPVAPSGLT